MWWREAASPGRAQPQVGGSLPRPLGIKIPSTEIARKNAHRPRRCHACGRAVAHWAWAASSERKGLVRRAVPAFPSPSVRRERKQGVCGPLLGPPARGHPFQVRSCLHDGDLEPLWLGRRCLVVARRGLGLALHMAGGRAGLGRSWPPWAARAHSSTSTTASMSRFHRVLHTLQLSSPWTTRQMSRRYLPSRASKR